MIKSLNFEKLLGKTIAESGLKEMPHIFLFGVLREGKLKTPVQDEAIYRKGDRLIFTGERHYLDRLDKIEGLSQVEVPSAYD